MGVLETTMLDARPEKARGGLNLTRMLGDVGFSIGNSKAYILTGLLDVEWVFLACCKGVSRHRGYRSMTISLKKRAGNQSEDHLPTVREFRKSVKSPIANGRCIVVLACSMMHLARSWGSSRRNGVCCTKRYLMNMRTAPMVSRPKAAN